MVFLEDFFQKVDDKKNMKYFQGCKDEELIMFLLLSAYRLSMSLPRGAVGRSMVCDCGILSS